MHRGDELGKLRRLKREENHRVAAGAATGCDNRKSQQRTDGVILVRLASSVCIVVSVVGGWAARREKSLATRRTSRVFGETVLEECAWQSVRSCSPV